MNITKRYSLSLVLILLALHTSVQPTSNSLAHITHISGSSLSIGLGTTLLGLIAGLKIPLPNVRGIFSFEHTITSPDGLLNSSMYLSDIRLPYGPASVTKLSLIGALSTVTGGAAALLNATRHPLVGAIIPTALASYYLRNQIRDFQQRRTQLQIEQNRHVDNFLREADRQANLDNALRLADEETEDLGPKKN